jgi:prevent-host-death family protein
MTSNQKGAIAEQAVALAATKLDIPVAWPNLHGRYDLILDLGTRLIRVQCKYARCKSGVIVVNVRGSWLSPTRGYVLSNYGPDEVDAIAVFCPDTDACYLVPIETVDGRSVLHLRTVPAANGQRASIHSAADHTFNGAVAQLARATRWQRVGRRFESGQLHSEKPPETIGTDELRNRLGWYAERASRGETIHVTRRGKPYARLVPPESLLNEEAA